METAGPFNPGGGKQRAEVRNTAGGKLTGAPAVVVALCPCLVPRNDRRPWTEAPTLVLESRVTGWGQTEHECVYPCGWRCSAPLSPLGSHRSLLLELHLPLGKSPVVPYNCSSLCWCVRCCCGTASSSSGKTPSFLFCVCAWELSRVPAVHLFRLLPARLIPCCTRWSAKVEGFHLVLGRCGNCRGRVPEDRGLQVVLQADRLPPQGRCPALQQLQALHATCHAGESPDWPSNGRGCCCCSLAVPRLSWWWVGHVAVVAVVPCLGLCSYSRVFRKLLDVEVSWWRVAAAVV